MNIQVEFLYEENVVEFASLPPTLQIEVPDFVTPLPIVVDLLFGNLQDGSSLTRLPLTIDTNGQTQFNIFSQPPAQHWLIVNGMEEYNNQAYEIQQIGQNWRLVWLNNTYPLSVGMNLIFVTKIS